MNHKYIDSNTFEIVDNVFEVDEDIAEVISVLNKKGYHTKYCCSGHIKDSRLYEMYEKRKISDFEDIHLGYIINKNKEEVDVLMPYTFTAVYVMFDKNYNFAYLPKDFYICDGLDNYTIEKIIDYYFLGVRKKSSEIYDEIKNSNNDLLEWAQNLPELY